MANDDADLEAQKARAEELRRLRDLRNAGEDPPAAENAQPGDAGEDAVSPSGPNYVDLIDRKMRELDEDD